MRDCLGLTIRHENDGKEPCAEAGTRVGFVDREGRPIDDLPLVSGLTFETDEERHGVAKVTVECGGSLRTLEVVARLAEPIAGRPTKRVHILSFGTIADTIVSDADTGEPIRFTKLRIELICDQPVVAWVEPFIPTEIAADAYRSKLARPA